MQALSLAVQSANGEIKLIFVIRRDRFCLGLDKVSFIKGGEGRIAVNFSVDFRDIEPVSKGEGGGINCASASDEDLCFSGDSREAFARFNCRIYRGEDARIWRRILAVAADDDIVSARKRSLRQAFPSFASHNDRASLGRRFEVFEIVGKAPWQIIVFADDAIARAGDNQTEFYRCVQSLLPGVMRARSWP